jgi:hypothetical protein
LTGPVVNALPNRLRQKAVRDSRHLTEIDGPVSPSLSPSGSRASEPSATSSSCAASTTLRLAPEVARLASRMCSWRSTTRVEHLIYDPKVR